MTSDQFIQYQKHYHMLNITHRTVLKRICLDMSGVRRDYTDKNRKASTSPSSFLNGPSCSNFVFIPPTNLVKWILKTSKKVSTECIGNTPRMPWTMHQNNREHLFRYFTKTKDTNILLSLGIVCLSKYK